MDSEFIADGFQLSNLSKRGFGSAYIKIRQALITERILTRAKEIHPNISLSDIAAWSGLKPSSYSNDRTFANHARATLQYLRAFSLTAAAQQQDEDSRRKREALERSLSVFFAVEMLDDDWKESGSPLILDVGGAAVTSTKKEIALYPARLVDIYKHQPFRPC